MEFVPVDPDAAVGKPFVSAIECDVIIDVFIVAFDVLGRARQSNLFGGSEYEDDVALCFDVRTLERSDRSKQRSHIASIVAAAWRIDATVFHRGLNIGCRRKDSIQM